MNERPSASGDAGGDDSLVVRAKSDRAAFGLLFDHYYPRVVRYCLRRLFDRWVAEDVASDVFVQVAAHLRDFSGQTDTDFRCWLFRIATNAIHAHLRQSRRRDEIRDASGMERPRGAVAASGSNSDDHDRLDWPAVQRALEELDDREQTIVTLRFFAELSHDEIADVVGGTPGAVRTTLSRTLALLRERLDPPVRSQ